jgi:hypothetical protein
MTATGIFSTDITGLTLGTTYHFRVKADGGVNGNAAGNDMTFTTLGQAAITLAPNSSLKINPSVAGSGENVSINATILNSGGASGTYELVLKINGLIEKTQEATVVAGASQDVIFNITKDIAGTYQVDINGLTGSFVVTKIPTSTTTTTTQITTTPGPAKAANSTQILAIGLGAAVVVGLLIYLLIRRRT